VLITGVIGIWEVSNMDYASPGGTDTSTDLDVDKMNPAVLITTPSTLVNSAI
jgi:hypothetical protein